MTEIKSKHQKFMKEYDLLKYGKMDKLLNIEEQLGIKLNKSFRYNVIDAFSDTSYMIKLEDIGNSLKFIKLVYQSLFGDVEGLEDFINKRKEFGYATYSRMRIRLAIFNHFGFLEEVFMSKPKLLMSKDFGAITTTDIYKVLSSKQFGSLGEFVC